MSTGILTVGETVLKYSRLGGGWSEMKVARVTATQAILEDGTKLKVDLSSSSAIGGAGAYTAPSYYRDTHENRATMDSENNMRYASEHRLIAVSGRKGADKSDATIAKIVGIHKAAMAQISEIIKNEGLKNG